MNLHFCRSKPAATYFFDILTNKSKSVTALPHTIPGDPIPTCQKTFHNLYYKIFMLSNIFITHQFSPKSYTMMRITIHYSSLHIQSAKSISHICYRLYISQIIYITYIYYIYFTYYILVYIYTVLSIYHRYIIYYIYHRENTSHIYIIYIYDLVYSSLHIHGAKYVLHV